MIQLITIIVISIIAGIVFRRLKLFPKVLLIGGTLSVTLFIFIYLRNNNYHVISDLEVPIELINKGYSSSALSNAVIGEINGIKSYLYTTVEMDDYKTENELKAYTRMNYFDFVIEAIIGTENHIHGNISIGKNTIDAFLRLPVSSHQGLVSQVIDSLDISVVVDSLCFKIAEYILRINNPILLATYYREMDDGDKCIELAKYTLINHPEEAKYAYSRWGFGLRLNGDCEGAIQKYQEAIKIDSTWASPWNSWGSCLREMGGYNEEAIALYRKAIKLDGSRLLYHNNLAFLLYLRGDYEGAILACEKILKMDPKFGHAYNIMSVSYGMLDDRIKFYEYLEYALELKVPIWKYISKDKGLQKYSEEAKFKELIKRYKEEYYQ